jgi:hypothetical protein
MLNGGVVIHGAERSPGCMSTTEAEYIAAGMATRARDCGWRDLEHCMGSSYRHIGIDNGYACRRIHQIGAKHIGMVNHFMEPNVRGQVLLHRRYTVTLASWCLGKKSASGMGLVRFGGLVNHVL